MNINITAGGVGDVRAKIATQYSSIDLLADVDTTTAAPTSNQVLKWNGTKWAPGDDASGIASLNIWATVAGDTGSTAANSQSDTLTIASGSNVLNLKIMLWLLIGLQLHQTNDYNIRSMLKLY